MIRANTREFVDLVKTGGIGEIRRAGWEIEDQLESSTVLGRGSSLSVATSRPLRRGMALYCWTN